MFEQLRQKLALHQSYTLVHAFEFIDKDNSGFITIDELAAAMANAGYPLATHELAAIMRLFDKDHDGRVSYAEFVSKMMPSDATYSGLVTSSSARHLEAVAHPQRRKSRLLSIGAQLDLAKTLKALLDNDE